MAALFSRISASCSRTHFPYGASSIRRPLFGSHLPSMAFFRTSVSTGAVNTARLAASRSPTIGSTRSARSGNRAASTVVVVWGPCRGPLSERRGGEGGTGRGREGEAGRESGGSFQPGQYRRGGGPRDPRGRSAPGDALPSPGENGGSFDFWVGTDNKSHPTRQDGGGSL